MFAGSRFFVITLCCLPLCADIAVLPAAKHLGQSGLRVTAEQSNELLLINDQVASLGQLRARFYLRLDQLSGNTGTAFTLFASESNNKNKAFELALEHDTGRWLLNLKAVENQGNSVTLANENRIECPAQGWFAVELEWLAQDGSGSLNLWLNGAPQQGLSDLQNDGIELARLNLGIADVVGQLQGFYDLDDFELRTSGEIGTTCFPRAALMGPATQWPASHDVRFVVELANESCL